MESFLRRRAKAELEAAVHTVVADIESSVSDWSTFNWSRPGSSLDIAEGSEVRACTVGNNSSVTVGRDCIVINCKFNCNIVIGDGCRIADTEFAGPGTVELLPGTVCSKSDVRNDTVAGGSVLSAHLACCTARDACILDSCISYADVGNGLLMIDSTLGESPAGYIDTHAKYRRIRIGNDALLKQASLARSRKYRSYGHADAPWSCVIGDRLTVAGVKLYLYTTVARLGNDIRVNVFGPESSFGHSARYPSCIGISADRLQIGNKATLQARTASSYYGTDFSVDCKSLCIGSCVSLLCTGRASGLTKANIRSSGRYMQL